MLNIVAVDILKSKFFMSSPVIASQLSLINLPWMFKVIYGLISDHFTIYGFNRKYYIVGAAMV